MGAQLTFPPTKRAAKKARPILGFSWASKFPADFHLFYADEQIWAAFEQQRLGRGPLRVGLASYLLAVN